MQGDGTDVRLHLGDEPVPVPAVVGRPVQGVRKILPLPGLRRDRGDIPSDSDNGGVKASESGGGWPFPPPLTWYAAPDYIRLTCKKGDNIRALYSAYEHCARTVADWLGEDPYSDDQWGWNGYTGRCIGPVAWGGGHNGIILQVSGPGAEKVRQLAPPWDNVARLDVQITFWYDKWYQDIARDVARQSKAAAMAAKHRPWEVRHEDTYGNGDTCYLGARTSAVFARIYDKWKESNCAEEYAYAWRAEVELKDGEGCQWWEGDRRTVPGADYWAGVVVSYLGKRGVTLPRALPSALRSSDMAPKGETTNGRRLRWIANQVAPSLAKLVAGGVAISAIAEALTGSQEPAIMWELAKMKSSWEQLSSAGETAEEQKKPAT